MQIECFKMKFLTLFLLCSFVFAAPVGRDKVNKHASTHESGNDKVDHDLIQGFAANEHLDWTSDQGATNIDDNNVPHTALTSDPHSVTSTQVGLGNVPDLQQKLDATVAPGATDDSGAGYAVGSTWIDVTADKTYMCADATTSAAVWKDTSASGGADADAIHDNVAAEISAITEKTTPVSADLIVIEDSAASNAKKRVQIGNLPVAQGDNFSLDTIQTTDATNTTIRTYTAGTEFGDDDTMTVLARCLGRESNGASSIYARHEAIFRKDGTATVTEVGNGTAIVEETDDPAYTIDTIVSGSNVVTQVHGKISVTMNWDCRTQFWVENAV